MRMLLPRRSRRRNPLRRRRIARQSGPAASGAVLLDPAGEVVEEASAYLGVATNNVAEWTALVLGLEAAANRGIRRLAIRLDSELVVKQMRGEYRVKHADLQPLHRRARPCCARFEQVDSATFRANKTLWPTA